MCVCVRAGARVCVHRLKTSKIISVVLGWINSHILPFEVCTPYLSCSYISGTKIHYIDFMPLPLAHVITMVTKFEYYVTLFHTLLGYIAIYVAPMFTMS